MLCQQKYDELNRISVVDESKLALSLSGLLEKDVEWMEMKGISLGAQYLNRLAIRHFQAVGGTSESGMSIRSALTNTSSHDSGPESRR